MNGDHYMRFSENKLLSEVADASSPSESAKYIHTQFRAMILNSQFPCPGARTTFTHSTYRFGVFEEMGTKETAEALGASLRRFIKERATWNTNYTAFVSCYKHPFPLTHEKFACYLWDMLQKLHETDQSDWDPHYSSDPENGDFAFSYGGLSFFIAGMHSGSVRFARRFAWPTLIFNAHEQFEYLRSQGVFEKFRDTVRKRDKALQGCVNPASADIGSASEAIQYTGLIDNPEWKCPFKPKIGAKS